MDLGVGGSGWEDELALCRERLMAAYRRGIIEIGSESIWVKLLHSWELVEELEYWDAERVAVAGEPLIRYEIKSGKGSTLFLWELGRILRDEEARDEDIKRIYINNYLCGIVVNGERVMDYFSSYLDWVRGATESLSSVK